MTDAEWAIALYVVARNLRVAWDDMEDADTILAAYDKYRGLEPEDYGLDNSLARFTNEFALDFMVKKVQYDA